jgi:hypothetical protein
MDVHELVRVPEDLVVVEVGCWIEPQVQALLPAAVAVDEDVGLEGDGLAVHVAQESKSTSSWLPLSGSDVSYA